ncbi:MAG: ABC transporter ATP-binding protein [Desulfovibrio sp.]|nr:MAG: ABC transporter ATP-binding protein [Desulfovibrio sp.]
MLQVRNLSHRYGRDQVLHDLNFTVDTGQVVGLLGPNGAGKTTTMRILTGYLTPVSGEVVFDGKNALDNVVSLRRELGYMPENVPLYPELEVGRYLLWAAKVKESADPMAQVAEVMERCGLTHMAQRRIRHLSRGYKQRVGLAQALLGSAKLLILDEPTVGLDPGQIREIRSLIRELGKERTILLSSHILSEVELTCDKVVIINQGRILAQGAPGELAGAMGGGRFLVRLGLGETPAKDALQRIEQQGFVSSASPAPEGHGEDAFVVEVDRTTDRRADLSRFLFDQSWSLLEFRPSGPGLEEAFMNLVAGQEEAAMDEPAMDTDEEAA